MSDSQSERFAEVAVFSALDKTLHYVVPSHLCERLQIGIRVLVPLGRREATGLIVALHERRPDASAGIALRPIRAVLDSSPIVPEDLICLCKWMASYYFYPLGEVLQTALPSGTGSSPQTLFALTSTGKEKCTAEKDSTLLGLLAERDATSLEEITRALPSEKNIRHKLKVLEEKSLIERIFRWQNPQPGPKKIKSLQLLAPPESEQMERSVPLRLLVQLLDDAGGTLPLRVLRQTVPNLDYWVRKLQKQGAVQVLETVEFREFQCAQSLPPSSAPTLTPHQKKVFEAILPHIEQSSFQPFLLFGVTGSGKTEIYLQLVEKTVAAGKGALILVPEIALSTQMEAFFRQRFGSRLAIWHSGLPAGARYDQWSEILSGKRDVVLGVRSAIFMPIPRLGLIIVDEEHDASYKQDDRLRYHARDAALMRASMLGIPILLGSATPSLQSIHHSQNNRYTTLTLPGRIFDRPLPDLQVVDMRREMRGNRILSKPLREALEETKQNGRQALLFLNRRGFATFYLCNSCGYVPQCTACSVSLTYHQKADRLRCHYCGWEQTVPEACPQCGNTILTPHGFGTERVEEEVRKLLPSARIVRIDRDTVNHPLDMVRSLDAVRQRQADVLIGTQMIAKGHDFPNITLVGIINGDTALQIADFRAGETMVQLLMQVAGRAGRGEEPGRVILQTYNPTHYTIESVVRMDYSSFCARELESREKLQYPPFTRFLKLLVTASDETTTRLAAMELGVLCREVALELRDKDCHVAVLGPAPAPLAKLKSRYRWHLFIKAWTNREMQLFTETVLNRGKNHPALRRVQLSVDRDPMMSV